MSHPLAEQIAAFRLHFGVAPTHGARAPGRVNLIGEHTDYNGGFVFPCAIDREVVVLAAATDGPSRFVSREMGEAAPFSAAGLGPGVPEGWARYGAGMAWVLEAPRNLLAYVASDIPIGSGVSSSAALELAFGTVYAALAGRALSAPEMALLAQRCENQFVGVNCGIMDQMASACGRSGHAMSLDTRSLEIEYAAVPQGLVIALLDTKKPRALTTSAYNERRSQCEAAAATLGVPELRDATMRGLLAHEERMDPVVFRRARHIISENGRTLEFRSALAGGDLARVGELMSDSHVSLRDDYEVSCPELDAMWEAALAAPGVVGARMTGAGFGGCCVALVHEEHLESFRDSTASHYRSLMGREGEILSLKAVAGASLLNVA